MGAVKAKATPNAHSVAAGFLGFFLAVGGIVGMYAAVAWCSQIGPILVIALPAAIVVLVIGAIVWAALTPKATSAPPQPIEPPPVAPEPPPPPPVPRVETQNGPKSDDRSFEQILREAPVLFQLVWIAAVIAISAIVIPVFNVGGLLVAVWLGRITYRAILLSPAEAGETRK